MERTGPDAKARSGIYAGISDMARREVSQA